MAFPLDNRTFPESILLSCDHILETVGQVEDSWTILDQVSQIHDLIG